MGDSKYVGISEGIFGIALLVSALPMGYFSDKYGRQKIIRIGVYFQYFTLACTTAVTLWIGNDPYDGIMTKTRMTKYICFTIMIGCWGIQSGLMNGPIMALLADSTP